LTGENDCDYASNGHDNHNNLEKFEVLFQKKVGQYNCNERTHIIDNSNQSQRQKLCDGIVNYVSASSLNCSENERTDRFSIYTIPHSRLKFLIE